ncbi:uncharacterized protein A1O9_06369 [Exophiala aquamarina CBS 119918]|uniref:Uncharacterized protein n=1 Tax=Exophiala aquamarina CBS 119918 TaxID=1182545 RepID=A0A072PGL4_9EURO|nr:uncharacterized protein A1O9_06369 [Exophiala aquamarina CBS 119918]KEF58443.1 hypothetical protein A1O9_06369 [Exophiala aquamarina CBS 119918]
MQHHSGVEKKYFINPSPVRVAYNTVSSTFPDLLAQHDPDFVLHIGMAGGRDCYSLETRAHRDGYRIKDVDDSDGFSCGELVWKREGVPDCLLVHWDEDDVLRRWEQGVERGLVERGFLTSGPVPAGAVASSKGPTGPIKSIWGTVNTQHAPSRAEENKKKGVVKLSRDAGRFLCEFALFESLSCRWADAMRYQRPVTTDAAPPQSPTSSAPPTESGGTAPSSVASEEEAQDSSERTTPHHHHRRRRRDLALDRLGKVAFLHVPGWTGVEDVKRGAMIAEEAILALVASWEDGYRRDRKAKLAVQLSAPLRDDARKFTSQNSEIDTGTETATATATPAAIEAEVDAAPTVAVVRGEVTLMNGVGVGIEDLGRVKWRS